MRWQSLTLVSACSIACGAGLTRLESNHSGAEKARLKADAEAPGAKPSSNELQARAQSRLAALVAPSAAGDHSMPLNAQATLQEKLQEKVTPQQRRQAPGPPPLTIQKEAFSTKACFGELLATLLLVVCGCGSAMGVARVCGEAWVLQVSLSFGLSVAVLSYAFGHVSGGQMNPAVTIGLLIAGQMDFEQAFTNIVCQTIGSILGALLLSTIFPRAKDRTGMLAANQICKGWSRTTALIFEVLVTFFIMFVVLETRVSEHSEETRSISCMAVGFAVFAAHTVLIPVDGCSTNPTRSLGPAMLAYFINGEGPAIDSLRDIWIFLLGPCVGAALASGVYGILGLGQHVS